MVRSALVFTALLAVTAFTSGMSVAPAIAEVPAPVGENPWQFDHWPQRQPWQESGPQVGPLGQNGFPGPIDPQNWENPDHMTWADYRTPPGTSWNDPSRKGSTRTFKGALVLADYSNQPFVVTQPANSTVFGNPSTQAHDIPRTQVASFYRDFLNKPNDLNRGHTLHEYWMEDSGGRFGVELTSFGPYKMPGKSHEYGMEFQGTGACPAGDSCSKNLTTDAKAAWTTDVGTGVPAGFDFVFYLSAGQDESSTWQEFGQMKFPTKADVSDAFGPPDPNLPNWAKTRYVDWTSWAAGTSIWPSAQSGSSTQAESSGMSVFAHEFSHILGIGDNYNNPYGQPPRRAYSGIWEMLSRGTFNGPGGPHSRWLIPATAGASMGAQHMLRNKIKLKMVDERNVLRLDRNALKNSGTVTARITARSVQPGTTGLSGVNIQFGNGDLSPQCDPSTNPLCDGGGYQNYTVEVVDRMGTDSFTPDSGVLLAKTKNQDTAPFEWVIDANPQDIGMTDYVLPDGTRVPITIGDYRQLSDALFHAGNESGSEYEYVDRANRLHFYIVDRVTDAKGQLSYTVAIRATDGKPGRRGVGFVGAPTITTNDGVTTCTFSLRNTGSAGTSTGHPEDVTQYLGSDVYRLSATADGATVRLPNNLASARAGAQVSVPVQARKSGTPGSTVRLTATSETDPTKRATTTCVLP